MTATASSRSRRTRRHLAETGRSRSRSSRAVFPSFAMRRSPAAVRWNLRVGGNQLGPVGDGGDQPGVLQPVDGLVDRTPGPAGDGNRLQPVEEGHVGH